MCSCVRHRPPLPTTVLCIKLTHTQTDRAKNSVCFIRSLQLFWLLKYWSPAFVSPSHVYFIFNNCIFLYVGVYWKMHPNSHLQQSYSLFTLTNYFKHKILNFWLFIVSIMAFYTFVCLYIILCLSLCASVWNT